MRLKNENVFRFLLMFIIVLLGISCDGGYKENIEYTPNKQYRWKGSGGGFRTWGCGGDYIFGTSVKPRYFEVWRWDEDDIYKYNTIELDPNTSHPIWLLSDRYILKPVYRYLDMYPEGKRFIIMKNSLSDSVIEKWTFDRGWWCSNIHVSRNGRYVVVDLDEDAAGESAPEDSDWEHPRIRLGLIDPNNISDIVWFPELKGENSNIIINSVAISDDSKYGAVTGYDNGAAVLDRVNSKVLWKTRAIDLDHEISLRDITFSPDSKYIYTGGSSGCVYKIETQTGKIVEKWFATPNGEPIYGLRINSVAASADGRFVAAGLAPTGLTCIWYADTGKVAKLVSHKSGILMIMFSPNSKALATFDGGSIKIWKLPE